MCHEKNKKHKKEEAIKFNVLQNDLAEIQRSCMYACCKERGRSINNITIVCGVQIHPSSEWIVKGFPRLLKEDYSS